MTAALTLPGAGGGGPTRPFTPNFDEYLKKRFPGTPETFWLFLTFIWASFEKKKFQNFGAFTPRGSFFKRTQKRLKSYLASKNLKSGPNFMKFGLKLYFDEFYRLKKSDFQKSPNCHFFYCSLVFQLFSIVQYWIGHRIVKNGPIFMKFGQKLYFD